MNKTILEANVEARNLAHAEHNQLLVSLQRAFAPLVGNKILKGDGSLLEKFKVLAPVNGATTGVRVWQLNSRYSLGWGISASVNYGEHNCVYAEATVYVGNMDGAILKDLICPQFLRTDYTVDGVIAARANLKTAKEALSNATSALWPFNEFDR